MAEASQQSNMKSTTVSTYLHVENIQYMRNSIKYNIDGESECIFYVIVYFTCTYINLYVSFVTTSRENKHNIIYRFTSLHINSAQKPLVRKALLESTEYYVLSTWT